MNKKIVSPCIFETLYSCLNLEPGTDLLFIVCVIYISADDSTFFNPRKVLFPNSLSSKFCDSFPLLEVTQADDVDGGENSSSFDASNLNLLSQIETRESYYEGLVEGVGQGWRFIKYLFRKFFPKPGSVLETVFAFIENKSNGSTVFFVYCYNRKFRGESFKIKKRLPSNWEYHKNPILLFFRTLWFEKSRTVPIIPKAVSGQNLLT